MRQAAHLNSHRPAIIYTDGTTSEHLSFAEAWQRGVRMANALLELDPVSYTHLTLPTMELV